MASRLSHQFCIFLLALSAAEASWLNLKRQATSSSDVPQWFQTTPELFAGPTATGSAPLLVATNPAPFPSVSYIPNAPLETQVPISGNTNNGNIFDLFGQLSHYFPNPTGFGVDELPLPNGANISALYMLSRHGARYPTTGSGAQTTGAKIANATGRFNATGDLAFLNNWQYKLGAEILVPVGRQEMFDSGVLHYYQYGHLYPLNGTKIIARSTTQDRMLKSAEYFLAGFFGLEWTNNATLELILEENGFNNSLAGYFDCPNNNNSTLAYGNIALNQWSSIYLANAMKRINALVSGINFTISDVYNMQSLCAYETVALGYSSFCKLFTYEEWEGYEYSVDINFAGNNGFQSPSGRGVGVGWAVELLARLKHQLVSPPAGPANLTLDNMTSTFPLYQTLNFDFSHDTNIFSIFAALGLTQFAPFLPATAIAQNRSVIVSHMTPFAARLDIEIINAPAPVSATRSSSGSSTYASSGNATQYVHFLLNQRTIPLGESYAACGKRTDGWCELNTFIDILSTKFNESQYDFACFGTYPNTTYGGVTNGVPQVAKL